MQTHFQERRVPSRFTSFSLWTSVAVFFLIESYVLQDQLEIGRASAIFMFGTACLVAGACIALFALLLIAELVISLAFGGKPRQQTPEALGSAGTAHSRAAPHPAAGTKPNTRRPAVSPQRKRNLRRLGS